MPKTNRKTASLRNGRPPLLTKDGTHVLSKTTSKPSSKATRGVIRAHHNLHKSRAKALAEGNYALVADIDAQIEVLGGLGAYQAASLTGQSKERGGDSSTVLVTWLEERGLLGKPPQPGKHEPLRVLEVGALSSQNAISAHIGKGIECVKRIDLKSQEPGLIEEIDFMDLPIPRTEEEKFDVLSLSLVLNYVPEAAARGEMLKHTRSFLRRPQEDNTTTPCLFFVLPLPCVSNSRYMTTVHLRDLMNALGYRSMRIHQSTKLHYELFHLETIPTKTTTFKKLELKPGKSRNNFCITLNNS